MNVPGRQCVILRKSVIFGISVVAFSVLVLAARYQTVIRMGKQPDGSFMLSSGQRIQPGTLAFDGRPVSIALHPSGRFFAVLGQNAVFLARSSGIMDGTKVALDSGAGFNGLAWNADGSQLYASVSNGTILEMHCEGETLKAGRKLAPKPEGATGNPRPGGIAITRDGKTLFAACMDRNSVVEIDLITGAFVREYRVQMLPFTVKLSANEQALIVSNWGGRNPEKDDETAETADALIVVDPRGVPASGTVTLLTRNGGVASTVPVGLHPTDIVIRGNVAYIANAASDSISLVDIVAAKVVKEIPLKWGKLNIFGAMPNALAISRDGKTLYIACGGDNAIAEMELPSGKIRGYRPAGYFPSGLTLSTDGKTLYAVNTKGNGSFRRTSVGETGNAHDFQGTVSVIDLAIDLATTTTVVATNNGWNRDQKDLKPDLAVYKGAIKHVLYIIKENRTYDEIWFFEQYCGSPGPITLYQDAKRKMLKITKAIGTTLDDLHFVIQPLYPPTAQTSKKVIQNVFKTMAQRADKLRQFRQTAAFHRSNPSLKTRSRLGSLGRRLEDVAEIFLQTMQNAQFGSHAKQVRQFNFILGTKVNFIANEQPTTALENCFSLLG